MNDRVLSTFRKIIYPENNALINSGMTEWWRGTSFTANTGYAADRWKTFSSHTATISVDKDTDIPDDLQYEGASSFKYTVTSGVSTGAAEWSLIEQKIEGNIFNSLIGKWVTVSFWCKSNVTGILSASLFNYDDSRRYTFEFTINQADTWERKHANVYIDPSVTFSSGINRSAVFYINLGVGSNYHGNLEQWNGTDWGTSNAVDFMGTTNNYFKFTGAMISEGSTLEPYVMRAGDFINERLLCFRYYYILTLTEGYQLKAVGQRSSADQIRFKLETPVPMRAAPTVNVHASIGTYPHAVVGYNGAAVNIDNTFTWSASTPTYGSHLHFSVDKTSAFSGFAASQLVWLRNYGAGQGSLIAFDAEL